MSLYDKFIENVKATQRRLFKHGLYDGKIDGLYGNGTMKAVDLLFDKANYKEPKPTVDKNELPWIAEARKHIGLKEIKGARNNPTIMQWIANLGGWFTNDEVPWCGTFVAQCLKEAGRGVPKHWYRALSYVNYGTRLSRPAYGSIGAMGRSGGGGHTTFIVGITKDRKYLVGLGGNQSDSVNLMKFPISRFRSWTWPTYADGVKSSPYPSRYDLPVYSNDLKISTKES